ncbi:hypothetical protein D9M72_470350 [compost metagenome]
MGRCVEREAELGETGMDPWPGHHVGNAVCLTRDVGVARQLPFEHPVDAVCFRLEAANDIGDLLRREDLVVPELTQCRPDMGCLEQSPALRLDALGIGAGQEHTGPRGEIGQNRA